MTYNLIMIHGFIFGIRTLIFFVVGKIRREHIKAFKDLIALHQFDVSYD
ncbi:hypothetical protein US8_03099 [Bacillus altitudinis]|nr:hypothetical protein US8_03099 [Bacillus altitudinis]